MENANRTMEVYGGGRDYIAIIKWAFNLVTGNPIEY